MSAIQQWLASASSTRESSRAGILDLVGKSWDDLDSEPIVEDAYRPRGRPITQRGQRSTASGSRTR